VDICPKVGQHVLHLTSMRILHCDN
jgi:hypothetical protein